MEHAAGKLTTYLITAEVHHSVFLDQPNRAEQCDITLDPDGSAVDVQLSDFNVVARSSEIFCRSLSARGQCSG